MQDFSLKLFDRASVLKPKTEQQLLGFLHFSLVINLLLPLYLIYTNGFFIGLLILLLDLLIIFCYLLYVWFHRSPSYRLHFTMTLDGVRYRNALSEREQEFEWNEVDAIWLEERELAFALKNGEQHVLALDKVQDTVMLQKAKTKIRKIARRMDIQLM